MILKNLLSDPLYPRLCLRHPRAIAFEIE